MNLRRRSLRNAMAFTLVELLTVIVIIGILMALLLPAIGTAKENARNAQAKNDCVNIVTAIKAYYTEYGRYPDITDPSQANAVAPSGDTYVGDASAGSNFTKNPNSVVFNTVRSLAIAPNTQNALNPRRQVYLESRGVSNTASPKGGFQSATGGNPNCFFDPWGRQYNVIMDTDYDNEIDVSKTYTDFDKTSNPVRVGVGAFSMGKDNVVGSKTAANVYKSGTTKCDDQISWQ